MLEEGLLQSGQQKPRRGEPVLNPSFLFLFTGDHFIVVATVFEDPMVLRSTAVLYRTHSHELWVTGRGFTRGAYKTAIEFDPPLIDGDDVEITVFNRTHIKVALQIGKAWGPSDTRLKVTRINTGAGLRDLGGIQVANIMPDSEEHASGVTVSRSDQSLYQTAALRKLVITGSGLTRDAKFTFEPYLASSDYDMEFVSDSKVILSLKAHKRWREFGGVLLCTSVDIGKVSSQTRTLCH